MGFMSSVFRGHSRTGIHLHSRNILVPLELWHVNAGVFISDRGCKKLYQTADARDYIRQRMLESLYQRADARVSILESGCKRRVEGTGMQRSCLD